MVYNDGKWRKIPQSIQDVLALTAPKMVAPPSSRPSTQCAPHTPLQPRLPKTAVAADDMS